MTREQDKTGAATPVVTGVIAGRWRAPLSRFWCWLGIAGPGLLVMLADTDAGNIVTAADTGTRWGYRLALLPIVLIPMLAIVQDLSVRLGLTTGEGFAALIRRRFGRPVRLAAGVALLTAAFGSMMTEISGIVGVGELFGVPRAALLPLIITALLGIFMSGRYRRVERIAIVIGLFELVFFLIAVELHPTLKALARETADQPLGTSTYLYSIAAIIGATFNPWMIFYQASAVCELGLKPGDYHATRRDTWTGAILTQLLTTAVLVAGAAALRRDGGTGPLSEIGQISAILEPILGATYARVIFGFGVLGASLAAAIVVLLASVWGIGELVGHRAPVEITGRSPVHIVLVLVSLVACGIAVLRADDLVWFTVALQVLNTLLLPFVVALLLILAATVVPRPLRLSGLRLSAMVVLTGTVSLAGMVSAIAGLF